jgi:hypothetical protein
VIKIKSFRASKLSGSVQRQILLPALLLASSSVLLLSGCSSALNLGSTPSGTGTVDSNTAKVGGKVHGGQFPVQGSQVYVYAATTTGYGVAATQASPTPATTDANGDFTGLSYTCSTGQWLFLVAEGGDSQGDGQNQFNNSAIVLTSAMGPCNNTTSFNASNSYYIDEVTTVATEYALAGFSTGYADVSSTSTNSVGLGNAFKTVTNLVNLQTGQALTPSASNPNPTSATPYYANNAVANTSPDTYLSIVPYDTINALANVLANCVNTSASTNSQCTTLFSYTGGSNSFASGRGVNNSPNASVTLNTADAALYIAHNPGLPNASGNGNNVSLLLTSPTPANTIFTPSVASLATLPNDLTLTINFVGGGLGGTSSSNRSESSQFAIDETGNIWVPNVALHSVTELSPLGVPLSGSTTTNQTSPFATITKGGYTSGGVARPTWVAIDQSGNAWVSDATNCLTEFAADPTSSGSSALSPSTGYTAPCNSLGGAISVAVDGGNPNDIWLVIEENEYISASTTSGALVSGFPTTQGAINDAEDTLLPDYLGNMWYLDGGGPVGAYNETGTRTSETGNILSSPGIYAAFFASASGTTPTMIWDEGADLADKDMIVGNPSTPNVISVGTLSSVTADTTEWGFAVDGNNLVYLGVDTNDSVTPDNLTVFTTSITEVSPASVGYMGGSALTALLSPSGVAVDQAGNVWVLNQSNAEINPANVYASAAPITYLKSGLEGNATLTEFVGLAAPANPVPAVAGRTGSPTAAGAYGVKP